MKQALQAEELPVQLRCFLARVGDACPVVVLLSIGSTQASVSKNRRYITATTPQAHGGEESKSKLAVHSQSPHTQFTVEVVKDRH